VTVAVYGAQDPVGPKPEAGESVTVAGAGCCCAAAPVIVDDATRAIAIPARRRGRTAEFLNLM
jgi:hypothetical protein